MAEPPRLLPRLSALLSSPSLLGSVLLLALCLGVLVVAVFAVGLSAAKALTAITDAISGALSP